MIRTPEPRNQAEVLVATLAALGITLGRRQSLDVIAKLSGYKGWNEYAADLKKPVPQPKPQPAALVLPEELLAAMDDVIDNADDTGCDGDLTVTSHSAVKQLGDWLQRYREGENELPSEPLLSEAPKQAPFLREVPLMRGIQDDGWVSAYPFSLSEIGAEEGYGISVFRLAQHFQHAKSDSFTEIVKAVVDTKVYTLVCRGKVHVTCPKSVDVPEDGLEVIDSAKGIDEAALELLESEDALSKMTIIEKPEFVWLNDLGMPVREGSDLISTDPKMELRILALGLNAQRRR